MGKRKYKPYIVQGRDEEEFVVDEDIIKTLLGRLLAHDVRCQLTNLMDSCSFMSIDKFLDHDDDEDGIHYEDINTRQLSSIGYFLRRAILKHRWKETASLTQLLCNPGISIYRSTIINTCFLLLLNHPKSNYQLLEKFIRECTQYVMPEDVRKFIKILFAIRDEPLTELDVGKYVREENMYKVVDEIRYKNL